MSCDVTSKGFMVILKKPILDSEEREDLSEKYDFYVYMVEFNTSFIFCFKDKKQYVQFKLKYC